MIVHFLTSIGQWLLIIFLSVSPFFILSCSPIETTCKKAERLFSEKLYEDALPLYSQALSDVNDENLKIQLSLRLATCYLEMSQPETALALLTPLQPSFYQNQCLCLMSIAQHKVGKLSSALHLLKQCTSNISSEKNNLIQLEKGNLLIQLGDVSSAEVELKKISWIKSDPIPFYLAQLALTRISLNRHQFDTAKEILLFLMQYLPPGHILNIERIYLDGCLSLGKNQNIQAAQCFETILPKSLTVKAEWSIHVLIGLITSYLKQVLLESPKESECILAKTENLLNVLIDRSPTESSYLLLIDYYLIKAKLLGDPSSKKEAQKLIEKQNLFFSVSGKEQALLKYAEAAPTYEERNAFYEQLISKTDNTKKFHTKVWFFKGINHFEEGLHSQNQRSKLDDKQLELAAQSFMHTFNLSKEDNPSLSAMALKFEILALSHLKEKIHQAWDCVVLLISDSSLLSTFDNPQEIYCLAAWVALHLSQPESLQKAKALLSAHKENTYLQEWKEFGLKLEGIICLKLNEWQQADNIFKEFLQKYPLSSSIGEAWYWRAYIADHQNNIFLKKESLKQVYTKDPKSQFAAPAYFQVYSYRDYMSGEKKAMKHLQAMSQYFSNHPLLIASQYLIGLYHKKDLLSEDGHLLKHKNMTAAIEAFQIAESTFDRLYEKDLIPIDQQSYFVQIRYHAQFERALANLSIAQSSSKGKRQIFLEYAEEVFKQLINDFITPEKLGRIKLVNPITPYPKIWAEAEFKLAKTYEEKECWKEAEDILNQSLEHYQNAQILKGLGLMHVWHEKSILSQRENHYQEALHNLFEAEKAANEEIGLNPNEILNLWIEQSQCYKALNQLDQAMQLLSRVINEDVISPLRIKAMFLRADLYESKGRPELALKQLKAVAQMEGEWASEAKKRLDKLYEF